MKVTRDTYPGHAASPWLVVVPRRVSPSGKRLYRRFATKAAAADFAAMLTRQVRAEGEKPLAAVPADLAADATEAAQLLAGTGLTLTQAVRIFLAGSRAGGVANVPFVQTGGAGAAVPAGAPLPTVGEAFASMRESKTHMSPATQRSRKEVWARLCRRNPELADTPLAICTPQILQGILEHSSTSPTTWNTFHQHLSTLFAWALRKQLYPGPNPMLPIDRKHVEETEIRPLHPDALRALFAACRKALPEESHTRQTPDCSGMHAYIAICAFAGVRPTECSRLTWADISFEENVLSVRSKNSKTGGTRHIPMHPTLRAWLLACKPKDAAPTDPIAPPVQLNNKISTIHIRAGYGPDNPWPPDALRHTFATYYLKANLGSIDELRFAMGHATSRLIYTRYMNMAGTTRAMAEDWWQVLPE